MEIRVKESTSPWPLMVICAAAVAVFMVFGQGEDAEETGPDPQLFAATSEEIMSWDAVRDVVWADRDPPTMWVGVLDNGSRRDGYAQTVCMSNTEMGVSGSVVHVVDIVEMTRGKMVRLGTARC